MDDVQGHHPGKAEGHRPNQAGHWLQLVLLQEEIHEGTSQHDVQDKELLEHDEGKPAVPDEHVLEPCERIEEPNQRIGVKWNSIFHAGCPERYPTGIGGTK